MGIANGGISRFQFDKGFLCGVEFPEIAAQHGVYKSGFRAEAFALGQFHGFVDGCMGGNPVQPKDLVQAQAEDVLEVGILLPAFGLAGNEPIQRSMGADDAIDQFLAKGAIGR